MPKPCLIQNPDGQRKCYVTYDSFLEQEARGDILRVPAKRGQKGPTGRLLKWPSPSNSPRTPSALTHRDTLRNVGLDPFCHSTNDVSHGMRKREAEKIGLWKSPVLGGAIPDRDKVAASEKVRASYA